MSFPKTASRVGAERLKELLDVGVDINEQGDDGRTALFRTARLGKEEHVSILLGRHADPNIKDQYDEAPLQTAARRGHLRIVDLLLNTGADIDHCPDPSKTSYSESALCSAVRKDHMEMVEMLLSRGASPNAATSTRRHPMTEAAQNLNKTLIEQLAKAGADVNYVDQYGFSPLHHVLSNESNKSDEIVEVAKLLIRLGANVDSKTVDGRCPIHFSISEKEESVPLLRALLETKPDLSVVSENLGLTPLEQAVEWGLEEQAELLRIAGAPEVPEEKKIDEGDGITLKIRELPVEQIDRDLAADLEKKESSLVTSHGWEASRPHWEILSNCNTPVTLERVAYFARGYFNAPKGKELEDGKDVLGESYENAMERFINEGFIEEIDGRRRVEKISKVSDLKSFAKLNGISVSGNKGQLLDRILSEKTEVELSLYLPKLRLFSLTEKGKSETERMQKTLREAKIKFKEKVIELLKKPDLESAIFWAREHNKISLQNRFIQISAEAICRARLILEKPIPELLREEEVTLKAIVSASELFLNAPGETLKTLRKEFSLTGEVTDEELLEFLEQYC